MFVHEHLLCYNWSQSETQSGGRYGIDEFRMIFLDTQRHVSLPIVKGNQLAGHAKLTGPNSFELSATNNLNLLSFAHHRDVFRTIW